MAVGAGGFVGTAVFVGIGVGVAVFLGFGVDAGRRVCVGVATKNGGTVKFSSKTKTGSSPPPSTR